MVFAIYRGISHSAKRTYFEVPKEVIMEKSLNQLQSEVIAYEELLDCIKQSMKDIATIVNSNDIVNNQHNFGLINDEAFETCQVVSGVVLKHRIDLLNDMIQG